MTVLRAARVEGRMVDLTVADGRIATVRPHSPGPGVDLAGRTVVPGLWDNHVHFDQWALARRRLDLSGAASARDAAALVVERLRTDPPADGLLVGAGFRDGLWPDLPRADLLPAAPRIVLASADLHCCWLNTAAAAHYGVPAGVLREQYWHPVMEDIRRAGDVDQ
ncbi:amidohydrolase family protein, partial [Pseudonocardia pini]|uniref:amidohydrolase family protein n=1 Tax=Pseudonocardia pini TaxID=2758030 RepID=UPI0015F00F8A